MHAGAAVYMLKAVFVSMFITCACCAATSDPRPELEHINATLLCAASKDAVVVWDLAAAYDTASRSEALTDPIQVRTSSFIIAS